jgi:predicted DNA-binding ribbon-helix-helix protein
MRVPAPVADSPTAMKGGLRKRSVVIAGQATSLTLEEAFWQDLRAVARRRGVPVTALVRAVDAGREGNLSSALRLFVLDCYRSGELGPGR